MTLELIRPSSSDADLASGYIAFIDRMIARAFLGTAGATATKDEEAHYNAFKRNAFGPKPRLIGHEVEL